MLSIAELHNGSTRRDNDIRDVYYRNTVPTTMYIKFVHRIAEYNCITCHY